MSNEHANNRIDICCPSCKGNSRSIEVAYLSDESRLLYQCYCGTKWEQEINIMAKPEPPAARVWIEDKTGRICVSLRRYKCKEVRAINIKIDEAYLEPVYEGQEVKCIELNKMNNDYISKDR
jgi:hypothetical protein